MLVGAALVLLLIAGIQSKVLVISPKLALNAPTAGREYYGRFKCRPRTNNLSRNRRMSCCTRQDYRPICVI